ncbi:hypothetical protein QKW60_10150 [Defluviimonas aestuarii]|uniref:hypothetical protein n=1 Tax=Albidovulum aestuarii TaxID=1130726 RepID=UPI00249C0ED9|nr:hypothetical protein [Defluviimonas aestuarii]MDI3336770.1 hypothetical protein [Defluviimonas aestuarii]
MKLLTTFVAIILTSFTSSELHAAELTCNMSQYSGAGNKRDIQAIVPAQSIHTVDENSARMNGTNAVGTVERKAGVMMITYFDRLNRVGDVEIKYEFNKSNGKVLVRTRGLRSQPWEEDYPERSGKFSIRGICNLR